MSDMHHNLATSCTCLPADDVGPGVLEVNPTCPVHLPCPSCQAPIGKGHTDRCKLPIQPEVTSTFYRPCLDCGGTIETESGEQEPHTCAHADEFREVVAHAYWSGHDRAKLGQASRATVDLDRYLDGHVMQCPSDGAHDPHLFVLCPVGKHTWESVWLCNGFGPGYTHSVDGEEDS